VRNMTANDLARGGPVMNGAALIAFVIVAAAAARWTDVGTVRVAPVIATESKDLLFEERADGSVVVTDAVRPEMVRVVHPSSPEGFIRVALQSLVRERQNAGVATSAPYRLVRDAGGRIWLEDLATNRRLTLDAFGGGNARAFSQLFAKGHGSQ
jgi:putative photosynthetic complex assembly protein